MKALNPDLSGKLLIAMPGMGDPRFDHAVIFICAHSDEGAMGLIVNKPATEVRFSDLLEQLEITPDPGLRDIRVHLGGPVEESRGFVLHTTDYASDQGTLQVDEGTAMTATLDVLEEIAHGRGPKSSLLALGYAGWGPGQLESELAQNGWLIGEAQHAVVFGRANEHKWAAALKGLGIDPLSLSPTSGTA
ncbi:MAG: YqgE/AlgH family protein [Limimaricola soesokkakensis]|uniref:YqgE/AlgH family protein n=1 Tax=Limimaricola TaxID=2211638 RepID=UPI0022AF2A2F|nr:YqgE/AlgH family protein [Limimaricola sp. G21655-S1]MCZ4259544.1 YqgE/AlgH family protein [Limimaricola sp. G21655-S1]